MKKYLCRGYGRTINALGRCYGFEHIIMTDTEEAARIELYRVYEHITRHLTIRELAE